MMPAAQRILRVVQESGPRKTTVLRGLCETDEEFERAVGQLFIAGVVSWYGCKGGRTLGRRTKL